MMERLKNRNLRLLFYFGIFFYVLGVYLFVKGFSFRGTPEVQLILSTVSATVGLISGLVALIKFDTRKKTKYLFVGFGFLGAAFLDANYWLSKGVSGLTGLPKWNLSPVFLSVMLVISFLVWFWKKTRPPKRDKPTLLFQFFALCFSAAFAGVLACLNLPKDLIVIMASFFYFAALVAYFWKGTWQYKYFEHFLVASLIVLLLSQLLFLGSSAKVDDAMFVVAGAIQVLGYGLALAGLLASTYNAFKLVEMYGQKVEARLAASIDSLPLGYVLADADNKIIKTNKIIAAMLAVKTNQSVETKIEQVFNLKRRIKECRQKGLKFREEEITYHDRYLLFLLTPVFLKSEIVGTVMLVQDITETKLLDRSKDEFIALASHELRTPVTTIRGNIELIREMYSDLLKKKDFCGIIDDIHDSSIKLANIIEEFLAVSSLEQKKVRFKKERFSLNQTVRETVDSLSKLAAEKDLFLKLKFDQSGELFVLGDEVRTKQILHNLVGNAIKFTHQGGMTISVAKEGNFAKVSIADTGIGIGRKDQAMLFKKFQQVGEDFLKHDSTQGVGLGLYISAMLVKNMGGEISLVRSKKNKGSEFAFTLPLAT